ILFISFSAYHLMQKGWIGFHDNSPWAELFERVGFKGLIFNIGILGWRLIDFGRIGIWIVFIILMIRQRGRVFKDADTRLLFLIFIILLLILSVNMLWARNLLAHRYLLPVYISFSLLCAHILFTYKINEKLKIMLISFWLMALMTGNLWVYPEKTAQGWDSTLAHLPYYKIRKQAIDYLDRQEIDFNEVQSFFPNNSKIDYVDLNGDNRQFADFDNSGKYVIYSNVFNISDEDYDLIRKSYPVIKQFKRGLLYIYICKRK
ncbi:MAG TPA: hypothetical protein DDW27_21075, partial [Bacteroidales bacterium]|nr:hypothetical protein [Bacteroidales bacterium]